VDAFWSVTMYDEEGFPVANELNRFAIADRDPLRSNDDGSLDIHIQHNDPGPHAQSNLASSSGAEEAVARARGAGSQTTVAPPGTSRHGARTGERVRSHQPAGGGEPEERGHCRSDDGRLARST
jgi:hypothetical protein